MTRFALLLTSATFSNQTLASVLVFANAAINNGHCIDHIFLYQDAVYSVAYHTDLPADEPDLSTALAEFCLEHQVDLLFCVTAAEKRGVIGTGLLPKPGYTAAGLAEFAMRQVNIDKLVQF